MCNKEPFPQSRTVTIIAPDSTGGVILSCCARFHPPAGSSPRVKLKPDPVQLLLELRLICWREMLLHQVFMSYLQTHKSSCNIFFTAMPAVWLQGCGCQSAGTATWCTLKCLNNYLMVWLLLCMLSNALVHDQMPEQLMTSSSASAELCV